MFKAAFAERRCLVPAHAYYEWRDDPDGKTPFAVARIDGEPVAFGGIWPKGEILQTFATITTDANRQLAVCDLVPHRLESVRQWQTTRYLIAIEQVARKLSEQATKGTLSVLAKHSLAQIGRHSIGEYSEPAIRRVMLRPFGEPAYRVRHRGMRTA